VTEVSVVIGNFEGERVLPDALNSLAAQEHAPAETIVVDASSQDGSVEVATARGAHVLATANRGLGYLYNRGAESASSPYVLLLNNDVALEPACIELLACALDEDRMLFAADATQISWEGDQLVHGRTIVRRGALLREYVPGMHLDHTEVSEEIVPVVAANGAAMLVRRDRFLELGGFDETFFMEWEDLDLCWRAWLRGWPTVYVPGARLRHRVGAVTTKRTQPKRSRSSHHNLMRFALKCLPPAAAARVVTAELLRMPRHPAIVPAAFAAIARELPAIARDRRRIKPSGAVYDRLLQL
jgi:GT2 family glycosyltransferase